MPIHYIEADAFIHSFIHSFIHAYVMIQTCAALYCCVALQYHGGLCPYTTEKLMTASFLDGVMECPLNCKGPTEGNKKGNRSLCKVGVCLTPGC
jgi:hypothetical protein